MQGHRADGAIEIPVTLVAGFAERYDRRHGKWDPPRKLSIKIFFYQRFTEALNRTGPVDTETDHLN